MAVEEREIRQREGDRFRVALEGQEPDEHGCVRPIVHHGVLSHEGGSHERPLVHVVRMDQEKPCGLSHQGELRHRVDPEHPVPLDMRHSSASPVALDLRVDNAQHHLNVRSALQEPIHHALQLKTPLQVRFVNPWHAASDYSVSVELRGQTLLTVRVQGTTTLTPDAAPPGPCVDPEQSPGLRVRTMTDVVGRTNSR